MKHKLRTYTGRFAPSPTGPLHLGSLYTALASFLEARSQAGQWLIRIEDLDPPREHAGATESILKTLSSHGLNSDTAVRYQSQHHPHYENIVSDLLATQQAFLCDCSRQQLKSYRGYYSGHCHDIHQASCKDKAVRFRSSNQSVSFSDSILGHQQQAAPPEGHFNDFVIKRRDGLYAYMLAVVIDDIEQGITHIVRGSDILDSSFKQIELYRCLEHSPPEYAHLPVISSDNGQKLSKQNLAPAINDDTACQNLLSCLQLLRQPIPTAQQSQNVSQILYFATRHWNKQRIPAMLSIEQINQARTRQN